jgi:excisionase family DNA binding protein
MGDNAATAPPPALLTTRQAAQYLSVAERTIQYLIERGELLTVKIGRATRVRRVDLDAYIEAHTDNGRAAAPRQRRRAS